MTFKEGIENVFTSDHKATNIARFFAYLLQESCRKWKSNVCKVKEAESRMPNLRNNEHNVLLALMLEAECYKL